MKAKTKRKKISFQLHEKFINEIKKDEKNINKQISEEFIYFYHNPLFLAKELYDSNKNVNDEIVKHINDSLIDFKKYIKTKKIPKIENLNKILNIVEKILNFNKQQIGEGLPSDLARILTPKQMFQRLPIALAQVKAGNTSENLLNKIRQIIYSLY